MRLLIPIPTIKFDLRNSKERLFGLLHDTRKAGSATRLTLSVTPRDSKYFTVKSSLTVIRSTLFIILVHFLAAFLSLNGPIEAAQMTVLAPAFLAYLIELKYMCAVL